MKQKGKYLKYGLHMAVLIGLVTAVVKYVNGEEVLQSLQRFNLFYLPFILALTLTAFLLKAGRFVLLISPFTQNIKKQTIYKGYIAGQAMTLLPGGFAARAGLMNQIGVPMSYSSGPVAFHSAWDQAVFLLGGLIAALWVPAARWPVWIVVGLLAGTGLLLLLPTTRNKLAGWAERIAGRFHCETQWQQFLDAIPQVFTTRIMLGCFLLTTAAAALQLTLLWLTMRGLGLEVPIPALFLAFIIPTMLGRIVPIPGGMGVIEGGMVGFLTATTQLHTAAAVTMVAIFRLAVIVVPAAVGAISYFFFWKGEDEVERPLGDGEETDTTLAGVTTH